MSSVNCDELILNQKPKTNEFGNKMKQRDRKKEHLNTDLLDAVKNNDVKKCQRILDDGADINAACQDSGATALMVSTAWGYLDVVSLLLERGASPLVTDKEGRTPVHVATAQGNEEVLRILLDYKSDGQLLNKQVDINDGSEDYLNYIDSWIHEHDDLLPEIPQIAAGSSPLHVASQWSFTGCVELLLEKGADLELRDARGFTPLDVAGEVVYRPDNFISHNDDKENTELAVGSRRFLTKSVIECLRTERNRLHPKTVEEEHNEDTESEEDTKSYTSLQEYDEELKDAGFRMMYRRRMEIEEDPENESSIQMTSQSLDTSTDFIVKQCTLNRNIYERRSERRSNRKKFWRIRKCFNQNPFTYCLTEESKSLNDIYKDQRNLSVYRSNHKPVTLSRKISGRESFTEFPFQRDSSFSAKVEKNCLHTAVKEEDNDLVEYLINENPNYLSQLDENGLTPGHLAVKKKNLKILSIIIKEAIHVLDSEGQSLLYTSAQIGWRKGVDYLLNANADIKKPANDGTTVLHVAARKKESKLLEELLIFDDAKQIIDQVDCNYQTPLWAAVEESSLACVEYLLFCGANPKVIKKPERLTLLHAAARNGSREIMEQLLKHGAISVIDYFTYSVDYYGLTPLHLCCEEGQVDCVHLLIKYGANISCKTRSNKSPYYGATPLHLAAKYGHEDVAKILIEKDTDLLNKRNAKNWQPLHVAARYGKSDCVRLIIDWGGNLASEVKFVDGYRKTALDMIDRFVPESFEFLQNIFDSFIVTNDNPLLYAGGTVTFNYDLFFPRGNSNPIAVLDAIKMTPEQRLQKMLLLHPLTETFLFLTWKKLRFFFFLIFSVHITFTVSITLMNLSVCNSSKSDDKHPQIGSSISRYFDVFLVVTLMSLILLAIQEIFQACRLRLNYLTELEPLGKWITYGLAGWLCYMELKSEQNPRICYKNISSVAILLAWIELLLMLSQLPDWGSNVFMFFRVVRNVLKVLSKFSFLFIGFIFALMIQFQSKDSFSDIWNSLLKVIIMIHEMGYDDMLKSSQLTNEESNLPWCLTSRIILVTFIILIIISLMNLLMGLAVNDIAKLEAQARTHRFMKQINFLSLFFTYYNLLLAKSPKYFKFIIKSCIEIPSFITLGKDKANLKLFPMFIRKSIINKLFSVKKFNEKSKFTEKSNLKDTNEKKYELIDDQLLTWENSYKVYGTILPRK